MLRDALQSVGKSVQLIDGVRGNEAFIDSIVAILKSILPQADIYYGDGCIGHAWPVIAVEQISKSYSSRLYYYLLICRIYPIAILRVRSNSIMYSGTDDEWLFQVDDRVSKQVEAKQSLLRAPLEQALLAQEYTFVDYKANAFQQTFRDSDGKIRKVYDFSFFFGDEEDEVDREWEEFTGVPPSIEN